MSTESGPPREPGPPEAAGPPPGRGPDKEPGLPAEPWPVDESGRPMEPWPADEPGPTTEPAQPPEPPLVQSERLRRAKRDRHRRKVRRRRILAAVLIVLVVLLIFPAVSYVRYMSEPSSNGWKIRSVEWVRDNHGAWLVNAVERMYYSWTAPKAGGPGITALPTLAGDPTADPSPSAKPSKHATPVYQPPPVKLAFKNALPGEGVWHPVGLWVKGARPVRVTEFRPERDYPSIVAYAAWIDTTRSQLALYPGRYEPPYGSPRGPMMVPGGQRHRLLAVFNSAFKYKDGRGGFFVNGKTYTPFTHGAGTLLMFDNGKVDIRAWRGGRPGQHVVLARQNLPMIVNDGKPNPGLNTNGAQWGWTLGNAVRVWRSGVGVDARGNLIYLAAPTQTVMSLADALISAGAVRALEFDINTAWPTFNYYRREGAQGAVKFLPNPQYPGADRYLVPDDRDFFAVYAPPKNGDYGVPFK